MNTAVHLIMKPKKGDSKDIKNYRPISITPVLMRLFEKIILTRIKEHLETNKLIIKEQSIFRRKRVTKDNLIYMAQKITQAFHLKQKIYAIYFD